MKSITMLETTGYGPETFVKGESYDVEDEVASALGSSCEVDGKSPKVAKAVSKPAKDKMVKAPKAAKAVEGEAGESGETDENQQPE